MSNSFTSLSTNLYFNFIGNRFAKIKKLEKGKITIRENQLKIYNIVYEVNEQTNSLRMCTMSIERKKKKSQTETEGLNFYTKCEASLATLVQIIIGGSISG